MVSSATMLHDWCTYWLTDVTSGPYQAQCRACGVFTSARNAQRELVLRAYPTPPPDLRFDPDGLNLTLADFLATFPDIEVDPRTLKERWAKFPEVKAELQAAGYQSWDGVTACLA